MRRAARGAQLEARSSRREEIETEMDTPDRLDRICPLCGGDNQCAMAGNSPVTECWCVKTAIDHQRLAAIPADARGKRCICPACAGVEGETD